MDMEFCYLRHVRLDIESAFLRLKARGEVVQDNFKGVLLQVGRLCEGGGEGVPISYHEKAVVIGIFRKTQPVINCPQKVPQVELPGRTHA